MTALADGLTLGEDGRPRCFWGTSKPDYTAYHDAEWGMPQDDDHRLFEKICLEGFQSGLSWLTILRKREAFREVFLGFDYVQVARFGEADVTRLLADARIVRHRGKIEATIHNAGIACELVKSHGSVGAFVWQYEPPPSARPKVVSREALLAMNKTEESARLAKDLKKLGWRFFGPTTAYAFMQAMGMVNDHIEGCCAREVCEEARAAFERPC